ncbi:MAG: aliphatic sulfonate ABC transporter substrate-binding protein [Deltaproteobacteria bacterium]|nr:aliphatic sulfonate ABC transporter substrate-binding protein [Deltaproteobacteria bacterium]MCH7912409.1 aliphatic sulfonate ABC transporter substrate-binding protein [Deltaproteobacteria bacterium]
MRKRIPKWFMLMVGILVVAFFALPNAADSAKAKKKKKKDVPLQTERAVVGKVRIAFSESSTAIVPLVAMEKGFLKAEGIEYEAKPVKSGRMALSSVYGGSLDIGTAAGSRLIQWSAKGWNMKAISVNNTGFLAVVLVKKDDTTSKTMADLKGKKIAIQKGSGTHVVWLRYLDALGLNEKMFTMAYMRTSRIGAAMGTGTVDAGVPWYPFARSILNRGLAREIISEKEIGKVAKSPYPFLLYARSSFIEKHPKTIQGVVNAWVKSKQWIEANREEAAKIYHKFSTRRGKKLKMEDAAFFVNILGFKENVWNDPMVADLDASAKIMKKLGRLKKIPDFRSNIDNRFVNKAGSM